MSFFEILYKLVIGPVELLLDVIFSLSMQRTDSPVLSIFVLSCAVSLLVLPLYKKADALQQRERELTARMKPRVDQIKEAFTGDERFMILQTYYRQNHYKPVYALRSSLSLLLQIPFFIAAYRFLSRLGVLQGVAFGPIRDLSAPDGILRIGGLAVNLLPVLMTAVNCVSGALYTRGMPRKSKLQVYGLAGVFLFLLYNSPSGLVLYWTLNNLFSLGRNLLQRRKRPKKDPETRAAAVPKQQPALFFAACALLTLLTGLLIPSAVIHASPAEFVEVTAFHSPLDFVFHAFLYAAGTFGIWFGIYYLLTAKERRPLLSGALAVLAAWAVADYMGFGSAYGNMSSLLVYDTDIKQGLTLSEKLLNAGVLLLVGSAVWFLWRKKPGWIRTACVLACVVFAGMSAVNIVSTANQLPEIQRLAAQQQDTEDEPIVRLDRNGKNVIVLMLDRGMGYYIPFIFAEKPELQEQYRGFTAYTNTLSYGHNTNVGAPALFGGYEYTPERTDRRTDLTLKEKHNEALRMMPRIFLENGWDVTVCDPPLANYQWIPDLSIYDDLPEIRTFVTEGRGYGETNFDPSRRDTLRERNLFCYSIVRIAPSALHSGLYDGGNYNKTEKVLNSNDALFMSRYTVLKNLDRFTAVQEDGSDTFLMMASGITHETIILQEPEYEPREFVDNAAYDEAHPTRESADGRIVALETDAQLSHYQSNMAAIMLVGNWLDFLREQGVYDNTRIIIASDHGWNMEYEDMAIDGLEDQNVMMYNPLLLVKDFGADADFAYSDAFMTQADTPTLAFAGLVENPVNPATGTPVTDADKQLDEQRVCSTPWDFVVNSGTAFCDAKYYILRNQVVLDPENWSAAE